MTRITRLEVIDENGRSYVSWKDDNDVSWQFQDDGRTLKVFVNKVEPKSPAEEAYKEVYGWYPPTTPSVSNYEDNRWSDFQNGYYASQEPKKEQKWDVVRESVKWCEEHPDESVEDYLKPHTPEKTEQLLREAFQKVQQTEEWKETQRKIDGNYDELVGEDNPKPMDEVVDRLVKKYQAQKLWNMVRDELGYSIDCCDEIVDLVEKWLPKYQSAAGSQNVDTELLVDGHNHCLNKMKEKLR
jgi:hypothetical protein